MAMGPHLTAEIGARLGGAEMSGAGFPIKIGGSTATFNCRGPAGVKMVANGPGKGDFQGRQTADRLF